jgi:hypothetical protein
MKFAPLVSTLLREKKTRKPGEFRTATIHILPER